MAQKRLLDLAITLTDKEAGFPILKSIRLGWEWFVRIDDKDKAFRRALLTSYAQLFWEAIAHYKIDAVYPPASFLENSWLESLDHTLQMQAEGAKANSHYTVASFDFTAFARNPLVAQDLEKAFITDLLGTQSQASPEDQRRVKAYIHEQLEPTFYRLLAQRQVKFEALTQYLNNTALRSAEHAESAYARYREVLGSLYSQDLVMGSDTLSLQHLYIEPHYQVYKKHLTEQAKEEQQQAKDDNFYIFDKEVDSLHTLANGLLNEKAPEGLSQEDARMLILLGDPGQGKTSFCKRLLHDWAAGDVLPGQNLYFVRLRYIDDTSKLLTDTLAVLKEAAELQADELYGAHTSIDEKQFRKSLLVLDGLDELQMNEGMHEGMANGFVKTLLSKMESLKSLRVVMTSRHGRLLHHDLAHEKRHVLVKLHELSLPQQTQWLGNYSANSHKAPCLSAEDLETYHKARETAITELIAQPILLHMVATLDEKPDANSNRGAIYDALFTQLIARSYSSDGMLSWQEKEIDTEDLAEDETREEAYAQLLRRAIREMAFLIYRGNKEYTRRDDLIKGSDPDGALREFFQEAPDLDKTQEEIKKEDRAQAESVIRKLMVSFYMREVKDQDSRSELLNSNYAIEFLHKSLQEYLTAEYFWYSLVGYCEEELPLYTNKKKKPKAKAWLGLLQEVHRLFNVHHIPHEMAPHLQECIANHRKEDPEAVANVAYWLGRFFPQCIVHDMLPAYSAADTKGRAPLQQSRATFLGYWLCFAWALDDTAKMREYTEAWAQDETVYKRWQDNLRTRHHWPHTIHYPLAGAYLKGANLEHADLRGANLGRANLEHANLERAKLVGAILRHAHLKGTYLVYAHLEDAHLEYANLGGAFLVHANLVHANLGGAILDGANLGGAILDGANLGGANLGGAILDGAILVGAHLKHAHLEGADLEGVMLTQEQYNYAKKRGAYVKGAKVV